MFSGMLIMTNNMQDLATAVNFMEGLSSFTKQVLLSLISCNMFNNPRILDWWLINQGE